MDWCNYRQVLSNLCKFQPGQGECAIIYRWASAPRVLLHKGALALRGSVSREYWVSVVDDTGRDAWSVECGIVLWTGYLSIAAFIITKNIHPMLGWCWPSVYDAGPTSAQHRVFVLCFDGIIQTRVCWLRLQVVTPTNPAAKKTGHNVV